MVRCGIAVYGMDPFGDDPAARGLEPALQLSSYVAEVKRCEAGESAGYGRRFVAERDTWLAVLPIGYGDGWRRGCSNNADVLIAGRALPRRRHGEHGQHHRRSRSGRGRGAARRGGDPDRCAGLGAERITAEEVAKRLGTINYEVTCALTPRVPRLYHRDGERGMSDGLEVARAALAGRPAWLVGGAVRDRVLGRPLTDLDLVVDGDPEQAARAIARAAGKAACFALSEDFGAWRVVARDRAWQADLERLRGGSLQEDLRLRDFTVNAIAEPIEGGGTIDPLGGLEDLSARRLRMAGPEAFADDPLRVLRLVRIAVEMDLEPEEQTSAAARAHAGELGRVSAERVFMELRRILASPRARHGIELLDALGATAVVLPELEALRGIEQNRFHHLDVYGHTLEVLDRTIELQADPGAVLGEEHAADLRALLDEPLADELTRGEALRWGALLHDAAKPLTRGVRPEDGRVTFIGHDARGAELAQNRARAGCARASGLRAHVAALVRNHLRLGFLVHEPQPLARRTVYAYLRACDPVEVDVTLLSVADRLATRGDDAQRAIDAHMAVARGMLRDALRWRAEGPPQPLVRGDELAADLGIAPGPRVGELLGGAGRGAVCRRDRHARAGARLCARTDRIRARLRCEMSDPDCIFCKILAGELPGTIVERRRAHGGLMDINPATRGHVLVIPRAHTPDLLEHRPRGSARGGARLATPGASARRSCWGPRGSTWSTPAARSRGRRSSTSTCT